MVHIIKLSQPNASVPSVGICLSLEVDSVYKSGCPFHRKIGRDIDNFCPYKSISFGCHGQLSSLFRQVVEGPVLSARVPHSDGLMIEMEGRERMDLFKKSKRRGHLHTD